MDKSKICHESVLLCYFEFFSHYNNHVANNFLGRVSATETVDQGSIPDGSNQRALK